MAHEAKPKRLSDAAQAAIVTGVFGLLALLLTQWKELPWNSRADASSPKSATENAATAAHPDSAPASPQSTRSAVPDTVAAASSQPAPAPAAQPVRDWVMPAHFTINQHDCRGPLEIIGTWDRGVELSDGAVISRCSDGAPVKGRVTGSLRASHLRLAIEWDAEGSESVGIYEGAVDAQGHVEGFSHSPGHPDWGRPTWRAAKALSRG